MDKTFSPSYSSSQVTYVEAEAVELSRFRFHRKRTASTASASLIMALQCKIVVTEKRWNAKNSSNMIAYSFFMRENNAWLLILKLPFLCFSEVATTSNLSFSAPAIVCHYVGIPASLESFLHCFCILVEGLSLLFHHASMFPEKVCMTMKKMYLHTHITP